MFSKICICNYSFNATPFCESVGVFGVESVQFAKNAQNWSISPKKLKLVTMWSVWERQTASFGFLEALPQMPAHLPLMHQHQAVRV